MLVSDSECEGVPVTAEVLSLRKVDWQTFSTNFCAPSIS
jgi:predicted lysophospholipase L1 biosynthesis ABC-type transport system permease subunit